MECIMEIIMQTGPLKLAGVWSAIWYNVSKLQVHLPFNPAIPFSKLITMVRVKCGIWTQLLL
jgi:hypothetical protein